MNYLYYINPVFNSNNEGIYLSKNENEIYDFGSNIYLPSIYGIQNSSLTYYKISLKISN